MYFESNKNGMQFRVNFKNGIAFLEFKSGYTMQLSERLFYLRYKTGLWKRVA